MISPESTSESACSFSHPLFLGAAFHFFAFHNVVSDMFMPLESIPTLLTRSDTLSHTTIVSMPDPSSESYPNSLSATWIERSHSLEYEGDAMPKRPMMADAIPETRRKVESVTAMNDSIQKIRESEKSYGLPTLLLFIHFRSSLKTGTHLCISNIAFPNSHMETLLAWTSSGVNGLGSETSNLGLSASVPMTLTS